MHVLPCFAMWSFIVVYLHVRFIIGKKKKLKVMHCLRRRKERSESTRRGDGSSHGKCVFHQPRFTEEETSAQRWSVPRKGQAVSPGLRTSGSPTASSPVMPGAVPRCQVLPEMLGTQDLAGAAGTCPAGAHTQVGGGGDNPKETCSQGRFGW